MCWDEWIEQEAETSNELCDGWAVSLWYQKGASPTMIALELMSQPCESLGSDDVLNKGQLIRW